MRHRVIMVIYALTLFLTMLPLQSTLSQADVSGLQPDHSENVEMLQQPLDDMDAAIEEAIDEKVMPGAVVLIARDGKVVKRDAYGYAARYVDDEFTEMDDPVEMQEDTIFDMASISKLFTAVGVMQLWDQGYFELDDPVANYLPEYDTDEKREITILQLLTHTSGEKAGPSVPLYDIDGSRDDRLDVTMAEPLLNEPGAEYVYSDINYMTLGVLIERLSGEREDDYIEENVIHPLGMSDTMYNPPEELKSRIAATEEQSGVGRGLVWGSVHDEKAWALDGVAGHAGVFSSADDMAVFLQMLLNKGSYQETEILTEEAFDLMNMNWNTDYPGQNHGLGWDLNQDWYMDVLAEEDTFGHTGYTGTSVVASPELDSITILLTNRVHPTRDTVSTNGIRKEVSSLTASSIDGWNALSMQRLIDSLNKKEEFVSDREAQVLSQHLKAISHYEQTDQREKVLKHLAGFKELLHYQYDNESISEEAFQTLFTDTEYLMEKWH